VGLKFNIILFHGVLSNFCWKNWEWSHGFARKRESES